MKRKIMKRIVPYTLAITLGLAGALGLASCSKEGEMSPIISKEEGAGIVAGVELEIPIEDPEVGDGMRAGQLFEYDLSVHNSYLKPTSTLRAGEQVPVVAYLRRKQMGASTASMRIAENWTVKVGDNGKKYLTFSKKQMTLPTGWDLTNRSGDEYYLMAMVGGERTDNSVRVSDLDGDHTLKTAGSKIKLPGIFLMDWTKLKAEGTTLKRDTSEEVKSFAPQGTILIVRAQNKLSADVELQGVRISSNVLDFSGAYNNLDKVTVGSAPTFTADERHKVDYLNKNDGPTLSQGAKSDYLVFWVMPRGERGLWKPKNGTSHLNSAYTKMSPLVRAHTWNVVGRPGRIPDVYIEHTTQEASSSVNISAGLDTWEAGHFYGLGDLELKRRKQCLPIEAFYFRDEVSGIPDWWTPYRERRQPKKFVDVNGYIAVETRTENTSPIKRSYHVPSIQEWAVIFPPMHGGQTNGGYKVNTTAQPNNTIAPVKFNEYKVHTDLSETITTWGETATYTADYWNTGIGKSFAIRFKGNGNKYRAAYRFEALQDADLYDYVKVTVRELGPSRTDVTINDVQKDSFWKAEPEANQCQVVRYIPKGYYWSSKSYNSTRQNIVSCQMQGLGAWNRWFEDTFLSDPEARLNFSAPVDDTNHTHYVFPVTSERE